MIEFYFDKTKSIESILYIVDKTGFNTCHLVSSLLYTADMIHLQKFARLIAGDQWFDRGMCMIPFSTYCIIAKQALSPNHELGFSTGLELTIIPNRKPKLDEF